MPRGQTKEFLAALRRKHGIGEFAGKGKAKAARKVPAAPRAKPVPASRDFTSLMI